MQLSIQRQNRRDYYLESEFNSGLKKQCEKKRRRQTTKKKGMHEERFLGKCKSLNQDTMLPCCFMMIMYDYLSKSDDIDTLFFVIGTSYVLQKGSVFNTISYV